MKRFAFRLERLRELRERAERERAAHLGAAMREEHARAEALAREREDLAKAGEQAAGLAGPRPVPAGLLSGLERARDAAKSRIEDATRRLDAARERVEAERETYGEARRELRIVEKLKEKKFDAWRDGTAREEQKENDEAGLRRRASREEP